MSRFRQAAQLAAVAALGAMILAWSASGLAGVQFLVPTDDPEHPRLLDADSLTSLNDRCPVRGGKLSQAYLPVYVNGRPIGFC